MIDNRWPGISDASLGLIGGMTSLTGLGLYGNPAITDLSPMTTLYDDGAFQHAGAWIGVTKLGLDLTTGTANRDVVDYLVGNGVAVDYVTGNTVD